MALENHDGDALPYLGFGDDSFYGFLEKAPPIIVFGQPVTSGVIGFTANQSLTIDTTGEATNVSFAAGTRTMCDVVAMIKAAYPGEERQRPYTVAAITDPLDSTKQLLVVQSPFDVGNDHGFHLEISGSAMETLGLSGVGRIVQYEPETFRGDEAVRDGFGTFAATLSTAERAAIFDDARMLVPLLVSGETYRAHASGPAQDIEIAGTTYNVHYFTARYDDDSAVFAHETGHCLGLPDLYQVGPDKVGTPPGDLDIMAAYATESHPVSWLKARHHFERPDQTGQWIDNGHIETIAEPPAATTGEWSFILTPDESPWISANPFAASHPTLEVRHSIELVPFIASDVIVLENRQKGPYAADHLGPPVEFSRKLPRTGVVIYRARRFPDGLVGFLPVSLLTTEALDETGDRFDYVITPLSRVKVEIAETLKNPDATGGNPSFSYVVKVRWETGAPPPGSGDFDLAITPWAAPPWESVDIWLDNRNENDWDVYTHHDADGHPIENGDNAAVGQTNRLYARVHNLGSSDYNGDVEVIWRIAVPQVAGAVGDVGTELGRVRLTGARIPAKGSIVLPPLDWIPRSSNEEHVCLKADIVSVPGEIEPVTNNSAQENITQWFSDGNSPFQPVTFEIATRNPYRNRQADIRIDAPNVPQGWTVTVDEAEFRLAPGATKKQTVTIRPYLAYFNTRQQWNGMIAPFAANLVALTPVGDQWVPLGGLTAVVDPVNAGTALVLAKQPFEVSDTRLFLYGQIATKGPLTPPIGDREIHARLRPEGEAERWQTVKSGADGIFAIPLGVAGTPRRIHIQVFYGGGGGIRPGASDEIIVETW